MTTHYFNRKLHSLMGAIPVGGFLLVHFTVNYYATRGPEAYNKAAEFMESLPFLTVLEWVFIFLPLLYHAVYGLYIAIQADFKNAADYGYFRNMMFMLQRITGIITLIFVGWHIWETRVQVGLGNEELNFFLMTDILSNNFKLAFYIIGVTAAIFHFCNGMWSFLVSWGITIGPRAQRISAYFWLSLFVIFTVFGIYVLFAFLDPQYVNQVSLQ